jgi:hypothetical protein
MSSTTLNDIEAFLFELYADERRSGSSPEEAADTMKRAQQTTFENYPADYNGKDEWRARWRFVTDALLAHFEREVRLKYLHSGS